jgi:hypothetical protein
MVSLGMNAMSFLVRWFAVPIVAIVAVFFVAAFVEVTRETYGRSRS